MQSVPDSWDYFIIVPDPVIISELTPRSRNRDSECSLLSAERNPDRNYPQISLFHMSGGTLLLGVCGGPYVRHWRVAKSLPCIYYVTMVQPTSQRTNCLLHRRHKLGNNMYVSLGCCQMRLLASSYPSFDPSDRLSARNNSSFTGRIFMKFRTWGFGENLKKTEASLKSDKNYRPKGFQEVKVPRFRDNGTGWW